MKKKKVIRRKQNRTNVIEYPEEVREKKEDFIWNEITGEKKPVMGILNKQKLTSIELDELMNGG